VEQAAGQQPVEVIAMQLTDAAHLVRSLQVALEARPLNMQNLRHQVVLKGVEELLHVMANEAEPINLLQRCPPSMRQFLQQLPQRASDLDNALHLHQHPPQLIVATHTRLIKHQLKRPRASRQVAQPRSTRLQHVQIMSVVRRLSRGCGGNRQLELRAGSITGSAC